MKNLLKRLLCINALLMLPILGLTLVSGCGKPSQAPAAMASPGETSLLETSDFDSASTQMLYCTEDKCYVK